MIGAACVLVALIAGLAASSLAARARRRAGAPAATQERALDQRLPILAESPSFAFTNVDGSTVDPAALRGRVWIADFIFTRCTITCPMTTAKMSVLRRSIRSDGVRFVSFSIDPEFDSPDVLRAYARRWKGDARWLLLSGPTAQVTAFAQAMNMPFRRTAMPNEPIMHSSLFFLFDQRGRLRGQYASLDDAAVRRLVADATWLESTAEPPRAAGQRPDEEPADHGVPRGRALFQSLGCAACHADARTGPPLAGVAGHTVRLEGGGTALADASYLRQSILDPAEKIVAGYNPLMPAYGSYLGVADVDDLIAYLQSVH